MPELATTVPPKGIGALNWQDIGKTVFLAAVTNMLLSLYSIINAGGWPTHQDFIVMAKATIAITIGNLIKAVSTNNVGQLFTRDKPIVHVDAEQLKEVVEKADSVTP